MRRRWILVLVLGLPALLAAAAYAFRAPLAEAVIRNLLAGRGVPAPQLSVVHVGLERFEVADLALGAEGEVAVRSLVARYALGELLGGRIARVELDGLRLALDLSGEGPPLGSLQPLLAGGNGGGAPPALPPLVLRAARLEARTPLGPVRVALDGEARPEAAGTIGAALALAAEGAPGRLRGTLDVVAGPGGLIEGTLAVDDGAIALPGGAVEGVAGEAAFTLREGRPQTVEARVALARVAVPDLALADARLSVSLTEDRLVLDAALNDATGDASATLAATVADYRTAPALTLKAHAGIAAASGLWRLLALPAPAEGRAALALEARGPLPAPDPAALPGRDELLRLATGALDGRVHLSLDGLAYPGRARGLAGTADLVLHPDDGGLALALASDAALRVAALNRDWLRALGLPPDLADPLAAGIELRLPAAGFAARLTRAEDETRVTGRARTTLEAGQALRAGAGGAVDVALGPDGSVARLALDGLDVTLAAGQLFGATGAEARLRGALAGPPGAVEGALDLDTAVAGYRAGALKAGRTTLALPLSVRRAGERIELRLRAPGTVRVAALAYGAEVALAAPLQASIPAAQAAITRAETGLTLDHAVTVAPGPVRARIARGDAAPLDIEASLARLVLTGGLAPGAGPRIRATIEDGRAALAAPPLSAERVRATLVLGGGPGEPVLDAAVGALGHGGDPAPFAPLALEARVRRAAEGYALEAEAAWPDTPARITVSGRLRPDQGRGAVRLSLAPLEFRPGALQPAALSPALASLQAVAGSVTAGAELTWGPDGPAGSAQLGLTAVSFETPEARVEGLDLALALDRLFPLGSPPGQTLTVRRIDPGIALTGLAVDFQIEPAEPARLAIGTSEVSVLGGRVRLQDARIDPAQARQQVDLRVEGLDLGAVFALLAIEGVAGEGRLSGTVPVVLDQDTARIQDGRLEAAAPGILRIRSAQAAQILAGAGEHADLLLRALDDFRYDELVLTIPRADEEQAILALSLLGKNPAVLEGYPFRFNINLEASTGRILAAMGEAYRLSNRLLRRAWMPRR